MSSQFLVFDSKSCNWTEKRKRRSLSLPLSFQLVFFIAFLIIAGLFLPNASFLQAQSIAPIEILETKGGELWSIIKKVWQEEILPVWHKIWNWLKENICLRIVNWLKAEIEKRKGYLKEGFEREKEEFKEEIKTEAPEVSKSLWERFKELVK